MACNDCKSDPRPANYMNDRKCAFGDDGKFTKYNWSCATMDTLRAMLPHGSANSTYNSFTTRDDISAASFGVFRIAECAVDFMESPDEELGLSGYVASTWYKNRGATGSCMIMYDSNEPRAITLDEAQAIIAEAKAEHEDKGRVAIKQAALAAKNRRIQRDHANDPVVRAWMEIEHLMSVSTADIANGLAHLASRIPHLKRPITVALAIKIMGDQFPDTPKTQRMLAML